MGISDACIGLCTNPKGRSGARVIESAPPDVCQDNKKVILKHCVINATENRGRQIKQPKSNLYYQHYDFY